MPLWIPVQHHKSVEVLPPFLRKLHNHPRHLLRKVVQCPCSDGKPDRSWLTIAVFSYPCLCTAVAYVPGMVDGPFPNFHAAFNLTAPGLISTVPEASTYGMMLAGLALLGIAAARREKQD